MHAGEGARQRLALALSRDGKALFATSGYGVRGRLQPRSRHRRADGVRLPRGRPVLQVLRPAPNAELRLDRDDLRRSDLYASINGGLAVLSSAVAVTNRTARMSRAGHIGVRLACPAERARACRGWVGGSAYRVARGKAGDRAGAAPAPRAGHDRAPRPAGGDRARPRRRPDGPRHGSQGAGQRTLMSVTMPCSSWPAASSRACRSRATTGSPVACRPGAGPPAELRGAPRAPRGCDRPRRGWRR